MLRMLVDKEQSFKCKNGSYDASKIRMVKFIPPKTEVNLETQEEKMVSDPEDGKTVIAFEGVENVKRWLKKNDYSKRYGDMDVWWTEADQDDEEEAKMNLVLARRAAEEAAQKRIEEAREKAEEAKKAAEEAAKIAQEAQKAAEVAQQVVEETVKEVEQEFVNELIGG